jgi:RNA polymerase sigma-70 factor (ECF subfamily)
VIAASRQRPAAFGHLFDRHAAALHRYVVRRLGPHEAAELVSEVFRIAFEKRASYDATRADARPWLYGIATNLIAKHHRREARRLAAVGRLAARHRAEDDFSHALAGRLDAAADWQAVVDALNALPRAERDALLLHVWEGLAYEEVAAALDIPIGTVRSRLNRARRRLRQGREPGRSNGEEQEGTAPRRSGRPGSVQR